MGQVDKTTAEIQTSLDEVLDNVPRSSFAYDDFSFPLNSLRINPSTSKPDFDYTEGVYLFDAASTETVIGAQVTSHRFKVGSGVTWYPHVHWYQEASGNVMWQLEYEFIEPDYGHTASGTVTGFTGEFTYTSGSLHQITELTQIDMSSFSSAAIMCKVRVSRLGADGGDTYAGDAKFFGFDFHVPIDQIGSREIYTK